jgi:hypothetical protein
MLFQVVIEYHCDNHERLQNARRGKLECLTFNGKWHVQYTEGFWMFNNISNLATITTLFIQYIHNIREKNYWSQKFSVFFWLIPVLCKENEVTKIFQAYTKENENFYRLLNGTEW